MAPPGPKVASTNEIPSEHRARSSRSLSECSRFGPTCLTPHVYDSLALLKPVPSSAFLTTIMRPATQRQDSSGLSQAARDLVRYGRDCDAVGRTGA